MWICIVETAKTGTLNGIPVFIGFLKSASFPAISA
jgi:hypothetical protein